MESSLCELLPGSIRSTSWYDWAAIRLTSLQHSLSVSERPDTPPKLDRASLTLLTHTFSFMHALVQVVPHLDSSLLNLEHKTGQTGRLMQRYRLCFARGRYCNWSAFQSLSFSRRNAIKADSICWISSLPSSWADAPLSAMQLPTLDSESTTEHCNRFLLYIQRLFKLVRALKEIDTFKLNSSYILVEQVDVFDIHTTVSGKWA